MQQQWRNSALLILILILFFFPGAVRSYGYAFSGTVLYDTSASWGRYPGYKDLFSGTVDPEGDHLIFNNLSRDKSFSDFGEVEGGFFKQGDVDYYYAVSRGDDGRSQMGLIWWSRPVSLKVGFLSSGNDFQNVYGLVFSIEGSLLYTPAQMIALRLQRYLETGRLPALYDEQWGKLYMTGCRLRSGQAFFGLLESPLPSPLNAAAPVPVPGTLWLLGSGIAALVGWRSKRGGRGEM